MLEDVIDVVEIGKVCIYLYHPVWLHKDDSANEEPARVFGKERFDLHPRDDIV